MRTGVLYKFSSGLLLRVASLLTFEEEEEVVKKIFVILRESNSSIQNFTFNSVLEVSKHMERAGLFIPEKDELWAITNKRWDYEVYEYKDGKIVLMGLDVLIEGIQKYYNKRDKRSRELRDLLRHYRVI